MFTFDNAALLIFIVPLLANAVADQQDSGVQELRDNRGSGSRKYYTCYQGNENNGKDLSTCKGRACFRITHLQTGNVALTCKNFTEEQDPRPGQCKVLPDEQLPGQSERVCVCDSNYCNGATSTKPLPLILLIGTICVTIIGCTSLALGCAVRLR